MIHLSRALLSHSDCFRIDPKPEYEFGTGDFTIMAMVTTTKGGTVFSYGSFQPQEFISHYRLTIQRDGRLRLLISDGKQGYAVYSVEPTRLLQGGCHVVAGIRRGNELLLSIDGVPVPTHGSGNGSASLDVSVRDGHLMLGSAIDRDQSDDQFHGSLMNVGIWSRALDGADMVSAMFGRVSSSDVTMQGYWAFDSTVDDWSRNNNPAAIVGAIVFEPCIDCVWAEGIDGYRFCQMEKSAAGPGPDALTMKRTISVPRDSRVLYASIMSDAVVPAFPIGAQVSIVSPSGVSYKNDSNTAELFLVTHNGQPWAFMAIDPEPGDWRFEVTSHPTSGWRFQVQTVPSRDVVSAMTAALAPLYGRPSTFHRGEASEAPGGFLDVLERVAVAGLVGVMAAGLVVMGVAPLTAVIIGVAAYALISLPRAAVALQEIDHENLDNAEEQCAGLGGFVESPDTVVLIDGNWDELSKISYWYRSTTLYGYVEASPFKAKLKRLVGEDDTRLKVKNALQSSSRGLVSACGHGEWTALGGYRNEDVLISNSIAPDEVKGKIFHLLACACGTRAEQGLGRALVAAGAAAFFGYDTVIQVPYDEKWFDFFGVCDFEIDKALIDGKSCEQAFEQAYSKFEERIGELYGENQQQLAQQLMEMRDALVAPSINEMFGSKTARLERR